jgi:predicted regulator of Ras-like GTPase activity (Roadblock/LC7/MglB family)
MNKFLYTLVVLCAVVLAGCETQSEIAKKSVEDLKPNPTPPRVQQAPVPVDPADVVTDDTTKQGATLFENEDDVKKSLNCKEYNRVMINGSRNEITIMGVCSQIMINGHSNKVTAVAAAEILTYGTNNEVSYTKFANGNRPMVTDTAGSNTVSKVAAAEPAKKK